MLIRAISHPSRQMRKKTQGQQPSCEISRLLSAAVINKGFRELLLSDPARALAQGYFGETFSLDIEQQTRILSIQADSLSDFARQITAPVVEKTACGSAVWIPVNQPAFVLHAK